MEELDAVQVVSKIEGIPTRRPTECPFGRIDENGEVFGRDSVFVFVLVRREGQRSMKLYLTFHGKVMERVKTTKNWRDMTCESSKQSYVERRRNRHL